MSIKTDVPDYLLHSHPLGGRAVEVVKSLWAFMQQHIMPAEAEWLAWTTGPNRWQTVPCIERLKVSASNAQIRAKSTAVGEGGGAVEPVDP